MTDNNAYSDIGDKVTSFNNDVALDVTEDSNNKSTNHDIEHTGPYAGMFHFIAVYNQTKYK